MTIHQDVRKSWREMNVGWTGKIVHALLDELEAVEAKRDFFRADAERLSAMAEVFLRERDTLRAQVKLLRHHLRLQHKLALTGHDYMVGICMVCEALDATKPDEEG